MTIAEDGHTSISILAGPLHPSPTNPGENLFMGNSLCININPDTARQWIGALTPIAAKETN